MKNKKRIIMFLEEPKMVFKELEKSGLVQKGLRNCFWKKKNKQFQKKLNNVDYKKMKSKKYSIKTKNFQKRKT